MKTIKISYSTYLQAPTMYEEAILNRMSRQELLDQVIKMTEYAKKLEGSK